MKWMNEQTTKRDYMYWDDERMRLDQTTKRDYTYLDDENDEKEPNDKRVYGEIKLLCFLMY
jgi:hypothetical protein